jgi:hypothetical protein
MLLARLFGVAKNAVPWGLGHLSLIPLLVRALLGKRADLWRRRVAAVSVRRRRRCDHALDHLVALLIDVIVFRCFRHAATLLYPGGAGVLPMAN